MKNVLMGSIAFGVITVAGTFAWQEIRKPPHGLLDCLQKAKESHDAGYDNMMGFATKNPGISVDMDKNSQYLEKRYGEDKNDCYRLYGR